MVFMKSVVLSGVGGGMGMALAKRLTQDGYFVFGLDIKAPAEPIENLRFIKTDLRDEKSVLAAFEDVKQHTDQIDAIINMAGIYDLNSLIEINEEEFVRLFDVNVFAAYRMNKTFMPLLKDGGMVLLISSELAPLHPLPFTGIYGITKATVEKYAASLRMELQLLGKKVVVVRPGAVSTPLLNVSKSRLEAFTENTSHYSYNAKRFRSIVEKVEARKVPPEAIAKLISKILRKKRPRHVYKINRNPLLLLLNILPKRLQDYIIKRILLSGAK